MLRLPRLPHKTRQSRQTLVAFGGLNYTPGAAPGELADSTGLSTAEYPGLSQREPRAAVTGYAAPTDLYSREALFVVDGSALLRDGVAVGSVTPGKKQWASLGERVVLFPDKKYYDPATGLLRELGSRFVGDVGSISYYGSDTATEEVDGAFSAILLPATLYRDSYDPLSWDSSDYAAGSSVTVYAAAALDRVVGEYGFTGGETMDISLVAVGSLLRLSSSSYLDIIEKVPGVGGGYTLRGHTHEAVLAAAESWGAHFSVGDGLTVSGSATAANNTTAIVRDILLHEGERPMLVFDAEVFPSTGSEANVLTIERVIPALSFVCESNNRLWGVQGDTIYASALGDPTNFFIFDGLSTDSYAVAVGSDGEFTGICAFGGSVLAFKEEFLHKVVGARPADYALYPYRIPGVQAGSERSMAVMSEVLYYKGVEGWYRYNGGTPELISRSFGTRRFFAASAGAAGSVYYTSARDAAGSWSFFSLDTARGLWLRLDDTRAGAFCLHEGALCWVDEGTGSLLRQGEGETVFPWTVEFAPFTEQLNERKCYSRLSFRMDIREGSWVNLFVSADGAPFARVWGAHDRQGGVVSVPVRPQRCDSFRVRIEGTGPVLIKSLMREFFVGSEV